LIDLLRSLATTTVVVWHWVFTILVWRVDGPHADNPIGYVSGLWSLTWVLQVMPLFFVAGGFVHARAWARDRGQKGAWGKFVKRRLLQLGLPALVLIAVVAGAGTAIALLHEGGDPWVTRAVMLVLSPLWFLIVYMVMIATVPIWDRLDRRWGELVPVALAVAAMGIDLVRFRFAHPEFAWFNMILVWGAAHQIGWSWERLRSATKRFGQALALIGFAGLVGLTNMGLYPRSMVGTTSSADRFSNMGPPTLAIVALLIFQVGLVITYQDKILEVAARPRVKRFVAWLSRNSMPLFLWHTVGFALFYAGMRVITTVPEEANLMWWVTRPLWIAGPLLLTLPLIALTRPKRSGF
jgi:Acyltransferase family